LTGTFMSVILSDQFYTWSAESKTQPTAALRKRRDALVRHPTGDTRLSFSAPFHPTLLSDEMALQPPVENQQALEIELLHPLPPRASRRTVAIEPQQFYEVTVLTAEDEDVA